MVIMTSISRIFWPSPVFEGRHTHDRLRRHLARLFVGQSQVSGPVPPELGDLSTLTHLNLHTCSLSGPLPQSMPRLQHLNLLLFHRTGLCAPTNDSFQAWIRGVPNVRGPNCGSLEAGEE